MTRTRTLALALAMLTGWMPQAGASGDYGPSFTMFRAWTAPDIPLAQFQAGELGVIQPGMRRVYLYTAWRALALGPRVAGTPGMAGGLARADGSAFGNGWTEAFAPDPALAARLAQALHVAPDDPQLRTIEACAPAATAYATDVLRAAASRPDATPARVDAWVLNQQQVGIACEVAADWRYRDGRQQPPVQAGPAPLAAGEPLYWRQLNDYQRAAWTFQTGRWQDAAPLFARIGATPGHPMQQLGAYLALRAAVRSALASAIRAVPLARRALQARALEQRGEVILADAALAPMHEPTRALLRSMRARLTPETRLDELNRSLDDPAADPFALDRLGDWSLLVDDLAPPALEALRASHPFIDWIETVRGCTGIRANPACEAAGAHALARWRATGARPWLVAALMLPQAPLPDLMAAGLALPPDDPGYVTVRYHLARLFRLAGKPDQARAIADGVLQRPLSPGNRNLLRQERFALARSVPEAAAYLLRTNVDYLQSEIRYNKAGPVGGDHETMLDDDGLAWLNLGFPVVDLITLARQPQLPATLRARVAGAAWIRATLLGDLPNGKAAGALLAQLVPASAAAVTRYANAATPVARRHIALVAAMRLGLGAQLDMAAEPVKPVPDGAATASTWCTFQPGAGELFTPRGFAWRRPPVPDTGHADLRAAELARLSPLKTATGVLGDDVLAWARTYPRDPDLPWLLHVVVMSTRGGCVDPDAATLSRTAWHLLHTRYADSPWAKDTPYFYTPGTRTQP